MKKIFHNKHYNIYELKIYHNFTKRAVNSINKIVLITINQPAHKPTHSYFSLNRSLPKLFLYFFILDIPTEIFIQGYY